ncbi:MAG: aminotransferase class I/II-fold pyridoxal phosphate-dependent enzyme [Bacillota bacterium]|nr:aminotransferase class I/II-fold pyridoxal phosphate-dependent enzyme [Bacillota bacterium]HHU61926.1 aminotransferase class I/II-fold pyridoxal phosphate-dependent enzyme [Natronincola sp.]
MIEQLLNKKIAEIKPSGIRKFFDIAAEMEGVVSLGIGEPDFPTPLNVREAGIRSITEKGTAYTANVGLLELRKGISKYLEDRFHLEYNPQTQILVTIGASEAVDLALRVIVEAGDEVLVPDPGYVSYAPSVMLASGVAVAVPTYEEDDFRLTAEAIEAQITAKTKAIIFCYPNNPTGAVMEEEDLRKIAAVLRKHNILVITDEIYAELIYGIKHTSIATLPGMAERTVVISGFSKTFSMTGWRLGYACGPTSVIEAMKKVHQYVIMSAPTMSQWAAVEALESGMPFVKEMVEEYDRRRQVIVQGFRDLGFSCFEPKGAFYCFPRISDLGLSSDDFCEKLLEAEKVAVVPGSAFGDGGEGFVRASYASSMENIKEALVRIERFSQNYK